MVNEPKRNILEGIENTGDVHLHDHRLRLKQRFDIIRKLGQGTYGKVQLGINKKTGQEVAIKTIKKCKIETEADLVRLRREVQIMSSVRHPNIIHIYEVFENSEKMILVMEYCSGGELYDYLSERKVLQEDEARRLFRQIATAVYYCHKHKICHRDLKLENVLLDEHGSAKIADFGLSNVFEEKRLLSTFCGSPLYASPEIVKGTPYIGPEVDCWSLGVLLYTLVYGAMPFDGSNFKRLVKQISTGDYFEPKNPSSASPLIRDMLTVDPVTRADITHICDHPWVNKGSDVACLELAEDLANETPVRLDLLLSLAPPPVSDKLVVTDEVSAAGPDGSPGRSMSVAAIDATAERRILEMVAEGGTDAIKPSPTRTIVSAEQPKRKLETTVSMDNAPSQRKKERFLRSSSKVDNVSSPPNEANNVTPVENNFHPQEIQKDVSMVEQNNLPESTPKAPTPANQKVAKTPTKEIAKPSAPTKESEPENIVPNQVTNNHVSTPSPTKTSVVNSQTKKDSKPEIKPRDSVLKEKNTVTKPSIGVKKKISSLTAKSDDKKAVKPKEKSPPRKSIEKDAAKKAPCEENNKSEAQSIKQPTERRKSRILDAAEKMNNLTIQPAAPAAPQVTSPPPAKPKKVLIPGVSVGSFKEQFERRASLTSGAPVVEKKPVKPSPSQTKTLADKKTHSVDSEHPVITPPSKTVEKEPASIKLQNIGITPPVQSEPASIPEPESSPKKSSVSEPSHPPAAIVSVMGNNISLNKMARPLHKSESLREPTRKEVLSLEDARKSLQNSIALISQAKTDNQSSKSLEDPNMAEMERQTKLKAAREIISNAIGDDNNTGNKVQRICMGGKPPVPYGASGRSASGSLNLSSLGGSPPLSPPHQTVTSPSATPPRTYRTEVQHRMEDVRNKFLPTTRGGSIERIIPIHFSSDTPNKPQPSPQTASPQHSLHQQLPYQRNNTMPYRLSSVPRTTSVQQEPERESSQPPTPFTPVEPPRCEPIKKSPREFIIPIAVEGVGYVTPRQGSLEPSDTPTKLPSSNMSFGPRFPKPRRLSSLMSGGESEDEEDMHMHRLRSSRRTKADAEKESVSSGEEDEDEEGFELLTAENLFSTLLDRVRNLTNRLNGEEGTGFPQRHQSLFNNLHSPFFNSPHLPRKHNMQSIMRDGPSWRRSTSRDMPTDFESMFPSHTTFPRGSRRSSRKGAKHRDDQHQPSSQPSGDQPQHSRDSTPARNDTVYPQDHLDLSDLDLSKIELTEKEVETLSGLTPGLSRRLQRQLLSRLPPAAARSLRRTLSAHLPPHHNPHIYKRSLSASKTDPLSCTSPVSEDNDHESQNKYHIAEDEEESSNSYNSAVSYHDKEHKGGKYSDVSDVHSVNNDKSYHSLNERSKSPSVTTESLSHQVYNANDTPDRSVLGKYLSPERVSVEKYPMNDYEYTSLLSEPSYIAAYGGQSPTSSSIPLGGSLKRRSLRTPPIDNGQRRISRFLRPDFFDTPREESIYIKDNMKDKKLKELETQRVLQEIRQKKHRPNDPNTSNPVSPSTVSDIPIFESYTTLRNSVSPGNNSFSKEKSRSVTPFYPSLDNISEHHYDRSTSSSYQNSVSDLNKQRNGATLNEDIISENGHNKEPLKESQIVRPKSFPSKPEACDIKIHEISASEELNTESSSSSQKTETVKESKLLRPKSYPSTSPSPEKFVGILPKPKINYSSKTKLIENSHSGNTSDENYDKQNISVSFNVSIPTKSHNKNTNGNEDTIEAKSNIVQNKDINKNDVSDKTKNTESNPSNQSASVHPAAEKIVESNSVPVISNKPEVSGVNKISREADKKSASPVKAPLKSDDLNENSQSSPSKETNLGEEKKKKTVVKKKIVVKKKSTVKKTDPNKTIPEKTEGKEGDLKANEPVQDVVDEKVAVVKKKSVLHSIGEKLEKFRTDGFNKAASQEKEITQDVKDKDKIVPVKEEKPSRIENVIRALRERSVPSNKQEEQATESGLIKRAVTITDLPTLQVKTSASKKTVNKVLGLFKKVESRENSSSRSETQNSIPTKCVDGKKVIENGSRNASADNTMAVDKPKRPTSLLLNGIGRRVQACYNGATSDSVLVNENSQPTREKTPAEQSKTDEPKTQKKGLRLDFSKLPRLNQTIFNKRNSLDISKSREGSVCKSREGSVCKSREGSLCKEPDAKPIDNCNGDNEVPSTSNQETPLSSFLDDNANNTLSSAMSLNWSPDYDSNNFMLESPMESALNHNGNYLPQRNHEATSPDPENIEDRIRRRSFYSRFNEKKNKRKSLLVGPGAKEYNPTERIHSHSDAENNMYYNRYDFSPTNSTKSDKISEYPRCSDRSECLSPSKYKSGNENLYSYKSLDRNDRKYLLDPQPYLEKTSQYSIPRYSRTVSMHDNYDAKLPPTEARKNSNRYGRSFSLLSPGNYNTYNPRTHSRNSAILLRDDTDTEPYTTDSILTKIRNRRKTMASSPTTDDDSYLDNKYRSNTHSASNNNEHDDEASDDRINS